MAQTRLHSLDIVPALDGRNRITVPEVMKAGVFIAQGSCDILEIFI